MPTTPLSRLVYISKALASRARLRLLATLDGCELSVGQLAATFDMATSTASEHLSELRRVDLVSGRRDGQVIRYSLVVDEHARKFLDVVLSELSDDPVVLEDRERARRIAALQGLAGGDDRATPPAPETPAAPAAEPDSPYRSAAHSNLKRQEVP